MLRWLLLSLLLGVNTFDLHRPTQPASLLTLPASALLDALTPNSRAVYIYIQQSNPPNPSALKAAPYLELVCPTGTPASCTSTRGTPVSICVVDSKLTWTCYDLSTWLSN